MKKLFRFVTYVFAVMGVAFLILMLIPEDKEENIAEAAVIQTDAIQESNPQESNSIASLLSSPTQHASDVNSESSYGVSRRSSKNSSMISNGNSGSKNSCGVSSESSKNSCGVSSGSSCSNNDCKKECPDYYEDEGYYEDEEYW